MLPPVSTGPAPASTGPASARSRAPEAWRRAIAQLERAGLPLVSAIPEDEVVSALRRQGVPWPPVPGDAAEPTDPSEAADRTRTASRSEAADRTGTASHTQSPRPPWPDPDHPRATLVLVGSAGSSLWRALTGADALDRADPVDSWCAEVLAELSRTLLDADLASELLWPGSLAPVQRLGALVGWAHPSRLGIDLHPRHGPWMAYRGLLRVHGELPRRVEAPSAPPCPACARPCVRACPAELPGADGLPGADFDFRACMDRREVGEPCTTRCDARRACPVGAGDPYPAEQIAWHHAAAGRVWTAWKTRP